MRAYFVALVLVDRSERKYVLCAGNYMMTQLTLNAAEEIGRCILHEG